ncbi:TPA: ankyrin repeat domain-containing protein [Legionella pneumophila]|uniref:ankyrin repeat domain-containing protein n=1 Tax=Legionella sp. PATHC039 TaxID=2992042 RepID=UPI001A21CD33|nr:ankyrin repeat domain-containing protein [Legionella sp. PATHC039]HAT7071201.1 ankyrin repeat domain-containing protein [Legionella pneumophila]HAT8859441.1 ankyrin repeat domain-containing protein [Legionella pneumophila subsp. pneumophila]MCW8394606.1 ankyrin repeat domain-containing protein [Legionella sp. PATHC039]HAT9651069.1 ankyrin repeat domain-containing protein [Legionella pneumophila subsp. pneumophila]HAT9918979.1 ankyrin repeat domain-containing protein [Legionella pneumophila 
MKDAAIEILIYKPDPDHPVPEEQRGVVVNPYLKQRFKHFLPIGVYLEGSDLRYYFFEQCDKAPKIYSNWDELKRDLPDELNNIFEENPKLFIMGHGNGGYYGLGNCHGPSEQLYDANFDKLLSGFKQALPAHHGEVFVTLEGCNTDSQLDAAANKQEKTFLERVSVKHPEITFGGTGPWDTQDAQTGFRSLSPASPITSMSGNIWKAGNSVIFHHGEYQIAVRKSLFASTHTAKELKVNTIEYARTILGKDASDELIAKLALNRDILNIKDLKKIDGFPELRFEGEDVAKFVEQENQILGKEQENYLTRVRDILGRADPIEQLTDRDVLELLLGLKEPSVFKGHEDLLESILANKALLNLAIVSCGKVLIGGPSNDSVIDLLLKQGADINSADKKGMTALHYAVQNFYNYRKEPLNLIKKLLECGASLEMQNKKGQTLIETAQEHSKDRRVTASDKLLASLNYGNSPPTPLELKQSIKQIFQMSQHKADELLSLPIEKREYRKCNEGSLYIPENVVEKLHGVLQSAKGNYELLSEFESELDRITSALERGLGTGEVIDGEEDEFIPKCFDDAKFKLAVVMNALVELKQEVATSKDAKIEDEFPKPKS